MAPTWTNDLSVHEKELDGHHQQMISLINKLEKALETKESEAVVTEVLNELSDYANYHVGAEEAMLETRHVPDAAAHIEQHMEFREHWKELNDLFLAGDETAGKQLLDFLTGWWPNHISQFDKKYIPYVQK